MTNSATLTLLNRFPEENSLLLRRLSGNLPLIVVHRGTSGASVAENTIEAFQAAQLLGADLIETDVIRSTDGDYFLFHNGMEQQHFGLSGDIRTLSTAELTQLSYRWHVQPSTLHYGLESVDSLRDMPDTIFTVDRSWNYWPEFLGTLAALDMTPQLVLKSYVGEDELKALAESPVKFPYLPIVSSMAEVDDVRAQENINTVGFELIARDRGDEFSSIETVRHIRDLGYLVQLNAMNLPNRNDLYLGWDDETSLFQSPDNGWGRLILQGADLIQTDWPSLLRAYREGQYPTVKA